MTDRAHVWLALFWQGMLQERQVAAEASQPADPFLVRTLAIRYSSGYRMPEHRHDWHQLIYAEHGVMSVYTTDGTWVVPSARAVWVPAGMPHQIDMSGTVMLRTLYLPVDLELDLPADRCCAVSVPPLLRELILHVVSLGMLHRVNAHHRRLVALLIDLLVAMPNPALTLIQPRDARARRVAQAVRRRPADRRPLAALAEPVGASVRTIERLFRRETGQTFGAWRRRARLLEALRHLAAGRSVTAVALRVGYESASAFVTMFRRELGTTPGRYFALEASAAPVARIQPRRTT